MEAAALAVVAVVVAAAVVSEADDHVRDPDLAVAIASVDPDPASEDPDRRSAARAAARTRAGTVAPEDTELRVRRFILH